MAKLVSGARVIDDPVLGDLRFSYKMQDAMLMLYGDAVGTVAPNGCKPQWAKLVSETCAPLAPCRQVHDYLASQRGVSQFRAVVVPEQSRDYMTRVPKGWPSLMPLWKASQWSTLWMDHARLLLQHSKEARRRWEHTGVPDEHCSINELRGLGAQLITQTNASTQEFWSPTWLDPREDAAGGVIVPGHAASLSGHPRTFLCSPEGVRLSEEPTGRPTLQLARRIGHSVEEFILFLDTALKDGHFFGRKFDVTCADLLGRGLTRRDRKGPKPR